MNYRDTSGGLEVKGVVNIYERSVSKYNMQYNKYLGDGDSRACKAICGKKLNGSNYIINKLQCIDYVQKQIGNTFMCTKEET